MGLGRRNGCPRRSTAPLYLRPDLCTAHGHSLADADHNVDLGAHTYPDADRSSYDLGALAHDDTDTDADRAPRRYGHTHRDRWPASDGDDGFNTRGDRIVDTHS